MFFKIAIIGLIVQMSLAYSVDEYLEIIQNFIDKNKGYIKPKNNNEYFPISSKITDYNPVDFIVIGGGTAGAIVAKRLSENPKIKIMVLEAGTYADPISNIPGFGGLTMNSPYDWGYASEPMKYACKGVKNNNLPILRGRGFGGTTIFNGLRYVRTSRYEWNDLAAQGYNGWDYNTMLYYYKKAENSTLVLEDPGYHGHYGPLGVENPKDIHKQEVIIQNGFKEININKVDFNGRNQLGAGPVQLLSKNGIRSHTGKGYIDPIRNKKNVNLLDNALALKLVINPKTRRASCVIFSRNKRLYRACAKNEIILSAGAVNTPQLLMLSGIGPERDLKKLKIPVVQNAPVGQKLIDHPTMIVGYINFDKEYNFPVKSRREHLMDFVQGKGEYAVATSNRMISFHKSKYAKSNEGADIMGVFNFPYTSSVSSRNTSEFEGEVFDALYTDTNVLSAVKVNVLLTNPSSRGSITLKSNSPFEHPIIDLNLLSHPNDVKVYTEGAKILTKLFNSGAFYNSRTKLVKHIYPNCQKYEYLSDNYWECAGREITAGGYHLYNTCPMGRDSKNAVVDSSLNVFGVSGLRIVDASVITKLSGYPMATVLAVAEKASDLIKKTYLC